MKRPGEILLISCYELGHQPHGLTLPLGFLSRAGFSPQGLDLARDRLDPARIERARLVGVSVPMHTALRLGIRAARRVREMNPQSHICFYGLYASLNAEFLLEGPGDSVLSGEFEESLVQLAGALDSGTDLAGVAGLHLPGRAASPVLERLSFPLPDRRGLRPLDDYAALQTARGRQTAGYVEASRGCLHHCRHCPIPPIYQGRFFVIPASMVLEDIRGQVRAGARHITFGDPDFLNGPTHSMTLLRAMHREFPELTFDFTAKIEHLLRHRRLLSELSSLGCLFVVSAVEALDDRILSILAKGHTRADVIEAIGLTRGAGITLRPSLVPFTPWTRLSGYLALLGFVETWELIDAVEPIQYAVRLLIPPGSKLLDHSEVIPHLGPLQKESFTFEWAHPDARMDRLHTKVSTVVEAAGHAGEDSFTTFHRIRSLARSLAGEEQPEPAPAPNPSASRDSLPRLTESWFC